MNGRGSAAFLTWSRGCRPRARRRSRRVVRSASLPLIAKDEIKESLYESLGTGDVSASARRGASAYVLIFALARTDARLQASRSWSRPTSPDQSGFAAYQGSAGADSLPRTPAVSLFSATRAVRVRGTTTRRRSRNSRLDSRAEYTVREATGRTHPARYDRTRRARRSGGAHPPAAVRKRPRLGQRSGMTPEVGSVWLRP